MPKARQSFHTAEHRQLVSKLVRARAESGLTQRDAAKKLNRLPNYIAKIEAGDKRIGFLELEALAKIYKKPLTYFQS